MLRVLIKLNRKNTEKGGKRRGIMIWGAMGIGKSSIVAQVARELGYNLIDERLAQIEPADLRGIPVPQDTDSGEVEVKWAIPAHFPRKGCKDTILFLDELPNANPSIQHAAYQLILDGEIGQYKLPDNVIVIAAGNREQDKSAVYRMPAALANRFVHIEMETKFEDWYLHALKNDFNPVVISYLQRFETHLFKFDANNSSRGFATPRSWEAVSELLADDDYDEDVKLSLIIGAIGEEIGVQFVAFESIANKLPTTMDMLEGKVKTWKHTAKGEDTIGLEYTAVNVLAMALNKYKDSKEYDKYFTNAFTFMCTNLRMEMVTFAMTTILKRLGLKPVLGGKFSEWLKANAETFKQAA